MDRLPSSEPPRRSAVLLGCGLGTAALILGGLLWLGWLLEVPSPGVRVGDEVPAYAFELIEVSGLLAPGETVRAFYDRSRELSGASAVLVTDRRLLLWDETDRRAVALGPGMGVSSAATPAGGVRFEVISPGGSAPPVVFEVAPGHGGERLAALLSDSQDSSGGSSNRPAG